MKKLSSILFVIVCMTSLTLGQSTPLDGHKNLIGIFGGLNIPRLSGGNGNELSRDYTSRSGGAFGLTCSIYVGSNFSLRIDALYSSEGGKRNGIQAFDATTLNPQVPAGTYFYANYNNESILNYFEIPLLVKYAIPLNKSLKFYVNAGPYVGILLNAKEKTSGSSIIYADRTQSVVVVPEAQSFDANTDITNDINSLNFGLTGGGGLSQRLSSGEVFVDLRGAYGLKVIQKLSENGSSHNGNMLIALGYALRF
jgi:hypothetical protein